MKCPGFMKVLHPLPKIACFVLYLKIINTSFEKIIHVYAYYSKLFKDLKNGIKIYVGYAVLEVLI